MSIDDLRETLRSAAEDAPGGAGLLAVVTARSRRRRRQRLVGTAVALGIVVAAPVAVIGVLRANVAPAPPSVPAAPAAAPTPADAADDGATTLAPAPGYDLAGFPFTPGWVPAGVSGAFYHEIADIGHIALHHFQPGTSTVGLSVTVAADDLGVRSLDKVRQVFELSGTPLTEEAVTVRGQPAVLLSNAETAYVSWGFEPGRRATVHGTNVADVMRYAEELVAGPFPAQTPFTFDVVPDGSTLRSTSAWQMQLVPPEIPPGSAIHAAEVTLHRTGAPGGPINCPFADEADIDRETGECLLPREPVQVGGRPGELVGDDLVIVFLEDGRALHVAAAGVLSLSREDLLRFAAGVHITPYAWPWG